MEVNNWAELKRSLKSAKNAEQLNRCVNTARRINAITDEQYNELTTHIKIWGDLMTPACRDLINRAIGDF